MTSALTLNRLMTIMRECAGESDGVARTADVENTPFDDLGYDSLARLETAGRVEREYGVRLTDDAVTDARTPAAFLALVNEAITAA